jgi:hypothetical protein
MFMIRWRECGIAPTFSARERVIHAKAARPMTSSETCNATGDFKYERPSIVVIQPDLGETTPMVLPFFGVVAVLAVDVITWGTAVRNITKVTTKSTVTGSPHSAPDQGPTLVTMAGLPAPDAGPEFIDGD